MATYQARVSYTAYAGQTDFDVTFPYLEKAHVGVTVNGAARSFIWLTDNRVRISPAASSGDNVVVARTTPVDAPVAVFNNSGTLNGDDLNVSFTQALYRLQEDNDTLADVSAAVGGVSGGRGGTTSGGTVSWGQISGKPAFGSLAFDNTVSDTDINGVISVAHGGTGANNAAGARLNLGLVLGSDVQAHNAILDAIAGLSPAAGQIIEFTGANTAHLIATPGGGAGSGVNVQMPDFKLKWAGVGDGTTDNDAAFANAEASAYDRIWLPEGTYYSAARTMSQFTKSYEGPGKIKLSDGTILPGRFTYWANKATGSGTGATGWFAGDQSHTHGEYYVIGTGVRQDVNGRYFDSAYIPHHIWMETHSGGSGEDARTTADIAVGGTTAVLDGAGELSVGTVITFSSGMDGSIIHTASCDWISGNTITFSPSAPQAIPAGSTVMKGKRTWSGVRYIRHWNYAKGDAYGDVVRIDQDFIPQNTKTHTFGNSTVSQYGGQIDFDPNAHGTMGTGFESQYHDHGATVAMYGIVQTFVRDNDTDDGRGQVWMGTYTKSEGSKPSDVAHGVAGSWRVGLDTVRADLSSFYTTSDGGNVAINTAKGHRWVMNSTADTGYRGGSAEWGTFFGNKMGDMFIESGADGLGDYIAMRFNRASGSDGRIRLRPNAFQVNVQTQLGAGLTVATDIALGASNVLAFGQGSGNYLQKSGGNLYWADGGTLYKVALVGRDL